MTRLEKIAKRHGAPVDNVLRQYKSCLSHMEAIKSKIVETGQKYRGYTLERVQPSIDTYRRIINEHEAAHEKAN